MAQYFFNPRSTYVTNAGQVASLGRLAFYESGTQTLKAVYAQDGVTAIANPVVLDAGGRSPEIKLGSGDYKVILESYVGLDQASQPIYTPVWTIDPYNGESGASGGSGNVVIVNNIADLRLIDITAFTTAYVIGYYVPGDLGQGWFNFDTTATGNDDQGSIIVPSGGGGVGRWLRLFEDDVIYPQMWGAMDNIVGATVSSRLIATFDYANASELQKTIIFPEQDYPIGGSISFTGANTEVIFKRGAKITRAVVTPTTLTINVKSVVIPINNAGIVGSEVTLNITTSDVSDIPLSSWGGTSDLDTLVKASNNYNGRLIIDRAYVIGAAGVLSSTISNAHFIQTGSISAPTAYVGKITFNRFTYEDNLTKIFLDDQSKYLFENIKTFQAQHFIPTASNIIAADYAMLINSVTLNGGRNAAIIWDYYSNYTFTAAIPTATDYKLEMLVGEQSTITFNFDVYFGTVVNQPGRKIFVNAGGSPILNQVIYPQWFGVLGGIAASTQTANVTNLTAAFACADVSAPSVIDGNNIAIYLNNPIVMPFASASIKLCNMKITIDATFAGAEVISAQSELRLEDVRFFLALKPAVNMVKMLGGAMYANRITVENGGSVYNRVAGRVREIKDSIITNMATMQIWCDTTQINITGNKFTNTELYFDDPGYIRVTGNEFLTTDGSPSNAICYLISPGNGSYGSGTWISTNVIISDNNFINQTASTLVNVSTHNEGMSAVNNGPCSVINNMCIGLFTIRATEIDYTESLPTDSSTLSPTAEFKTYLIFHSNDTTFPTPLKTANHIEPVSFSWVFAGLVAAPGGTQPPSATNTFMTFLPSKKYQLLSTRSGNVSWAGNILIKVHTVSNSGNSILAILVN